MTTALVRQDESELRKELAKLSVDDLRKALIQGLQATAANFLRLAFIVRELEERGDNLSELNSRLLTYLRLIAHGQLSAAVLVKFQGSQLIIEKVAALPMPDQLRLAEGQSIRLVVRDGSSYTHRMVQPLEMTPEQISQAFTRGAIRSEPEQINYLESKSRTAKDSKSNRRGVSPCPERGGILAGRYFIGKEDALRALAGLGTKETDDRPTEPITVKFTDAESKRLQHHVAESGARAQEIIRRALRATGVI